MISLLSRAAGHAAHRYASAALAGSTIAVVVWMLAQRDERPELNLLFALVVVLCGTTSFALYSIHRLEQTCRPTLEQRFAQARHAAIALGLVLLAVLSALQAIAG